MKKYLVVGDPIEHSLSPDIHNYWLSKNKINAIYEKKEIESSFLPDIISQMKNKKLIGVNVTIPYKRSVYDLLKNLDKNAKKIDGIDTLKYYRCYEIIGSGDPFCPN